MGFGKQILTFFTHAKIENSASEVIYVNRRSLQKFLAAHPKERIGFSSQKNIRSLFRNQITHDLLNMTEPPTQDQARSLIIRWGFTGYAIATMVALSNDMGNKESVVQFLMQFLQKMDAVADSEDISKLKRCVKKALEKHSITETKMIRTYLKNENLSSIKQKEMTPLGKSIAAYKALSGDRMPKDHVELQSWLRDLHLPEMIVKGSVSQVDLTHQISYRMSLFQLLKTNIMYPNESVVRLALEALASQTAVPERKTDYMFISGDIPLDHQHLETILKKICRSQDMVQYILHNISAEIQIPVAVQLDTLLNSEKCIRLQHDLIKNRKEGDYEIREFITTIRNLVMNKFIEVPYVKELNKQHFLNDALPEEYSDNIETEHLAEKLQKLMLPDAAIRSITKSAKEIGYSCTFEQLLHIVRNDPILDKNMPEASDFIAFLTKGVALEKMSLFQYVPKDGVEVEQFFVDIGFESEAAKLLAAQIDVVRSDRDYIMQLKSAIHAEGSAKQIVDKAGPLGDELRRRVDIMAKTRIIHQFDEDHTVPPKDPESLAILLKENSISDPNVQEILISKIDLKKSDPNYLMQVYEVLLDPEHTIGWYDIHRSLNWWEHKIEKGLGITKTELNQKKKHAAENYFTKVARREVEFKSNVFRKFLIFYGFSESAENQLGKPFRKYLAGSMKAAELKEYEFYKYSSDYKKNDEAVFKEFTQFLWPLLKE